MIKADLHTHSIASPDGGLTAAHYLQAIKSKSLDIIAITDHGRIDFALKMRRQLPDSIIVGEEIMTTEGEIIGLYLKDPVPDGLTPKQTIETIKSQGGIVYIPHPFETIRKGLHPAILDEISDSIDVLEICNGRAFFQNTSEQSVVWARLNGVVGAAGSDAHGPKGLGHTYTRIKEIPSRETLVEALRGGVPVTTRPKLRALLYPKMNRLQKKIKSYGAKK